MAKNPSTRWFFNDWMNEVGLRLCSVSARGLWMDMLCIAAAAKRTGYLVGVDGKPVSTSELARITKTPKANVSRWLKELERHGVFSRDPDGTIFNRRMVRENGKGGSAKRPALPPESTDGERNPNMADLFEKPKKTRTRARPPSSQEEQSSSSQDSLSTSNLPSSPEAARAPPEPEDEKHETGNPEEAGSARLGDLVERIGANMRMPAAMGPALCKGVSDAQTSQAPATDHGDLARERQDHPAPIVGEGQPAAVGPSPAEPPTDPNRGFSPGLAAARPSLGAVGSCRRTRKSPALRAKIRDQLVQKCARFLVDRRRPEELAAYWGALLGDDLAEGQRMLDAVDRRMRRSGWDDMREWKRQHGIAA
jgi:hypothetical protein